ncbi:efflux RND transporter periplasmic adaptor subunit [Balneolaceae bacterium YR4-1]|uniref:Efflux RND transporter periplasmic adaptor subunit n=1 Tax=Halalkalibaculum roseum TaxID=2709311 RepID=A0A6M1SY37_9BACT|nr:efflux RND transporter periplasmic adaptor subunit [Halalkalibaculum roseum]NGP76064.1 efflux RND transporter periplasmic adaptor subunit [Halalkalibaculum roseum]
MGKTGKSPTKKLLYIGLGFVVVIGVLAIVASAMGWLGGESEGKTVETATAKLKTITQIVSASGKIQPEVEVILRPEVSGEIIDLPVKEGDYVRKGDLLVRIKPDIYQARIDEINASLLTQKARMEQARASLIEAESRFNQQATLYEKNLASQAEYIQAKSNYEAQQANFNAAKYQMQSIEAQLDQAKEELQKTIIRSPRDGTISKLAVEQGERVLGQTQMTGTELMRIADMNNMEVQVQVNENDIVMVSPGDTTNIEADSYPDRLFKGIVTEIANSAEVTGQGTNEQVTNYEVKIRIITPHNLAMAGKELEMKVSAENPETAFSPSFKPGMSATVDIETETAFNVVSVPIQAVTVRDFAKDKAEADSTAQDEEAEADNDTMLPEEDLRKVVFIVEDGKAVRQEVETGISDNTHIQILSGVDTNQEIVIGSYRTLSRDLEDGDKVKVNNNRLQQLASGD